jgi:hypothetical protein
MSSGLVRLLTYLAKSSRVVAQIITKKLMEMHGEKHRAD